MVDIIAQSGRGSGELKSTLRIINGSKRLTSAIFRRFGQRRHDNVIASGRTVRAPLQSVNKIDNIELVRGRSESETNEATEKRKDDKQWDCDRSID